MILISKIRRAVTLQLHDTMHTSSTTPHPASGGTNPKANHVQPPRESLTVGGLGSETEFAGARNLMRKGYRPVYRGVVLCPADLEQ